MPAKGTINSKLQKANEARRGKPHVTTSSRVNLIFPVGRFNRLIKQGRFSDRVSKSAGVFMAAAIEYVICEIAELASNAAEEQKKTTITPRHI